MKASLIVMAMAFTAMGSSCAGGHAVDGSAGVPTQAARQGVKAPAAAEPPVLNPEKSDGISKPMKAYPPGSAPPGSKVQRPGYKVPGQETYIPRIAKRGERIHGKAPVGSTVKILDRSYVIGKDGTFEFTVPSNADSAIDVRIERSDLRVLKFRILIGD